MAQLVERSLPIPELRGQLCIEKTKIKKKRPGLAHFFKSTVVGTLTNDVLKTASFMLLL